MSGPIRSVSWNPSCPLERDKADGLPLVLSLGKMLYDNATKGNGTWLILSDSGPVVFSGDGRIKELMVKSQPLPVTIIPFEAVICEGYWGKAASIDAKPKTPVVIEKYEWA